uniref:Uncharacterized protein n=1 Tax=Magallana gigas TaxID=29159 RepID=A0A8W8P078_MAGGI
MVSLSGNSGYPHDVLTVLLCLLTVSQAYVNVALNKPAYQQYSLPGVDKGDASNAVDGRKSDLRCPATGYFGSNCSVPCSNVNCQYCHIEVGTCLGCKPGYKGHRCEMACEGGTYGAGCKETCGTCRDKKGINEATLNGVTYPDTTLLIPLKISNKA